MLEMIEFTLSLGFGFFIGFIMGRIESKLDKLGRQEIGKKKK